MKSRTFTKMHGTGNDFVVLDGVRRTVRLSADQARRLCDRHYGVGADQILIVGKSASADFSMKILNADGSEVEMCGNGIRCAALYARRRGLTKKNALSFETPAGIIRPKILHDGRVRVDMGAPILDAVKVPTQAEGRVIERDLAVLLKGHPPLKKGGRGDFSLRDFRGLSVTAVSMGNPHAVIFVDDVEAVPLTTWGPLIENHPFFPRRTNVEFVQTTGVRTAKVRVWERGAGVTLACGTGACAVGVAAVLTGRLQRHMTLTLPGGDLGVDWAIDDHVYLTGPGAFVFDGRWGE
jgi:diaminopimelate epimerase